MTPIFPSVAHGTIDDLRHWLRSWTRALTCQDTVFLCGPVGVGKTTFVQQVLGHLCPGHSVRECSPTFSLLNMYDWDPKKTSIAHMDLYRLKDVAQFWHHGLQDIIGQHLTFIEWPDLIVPYISPTYRLTLDFHPLGRKWTCDFLSKSC